MDNILVSARITRAKKERGVGMLASMGATTSDLINSAFDYVIANGELPQADAPRATDKRSFASFVSASTVDIDWPADFEGDYKQLERTMRSQAYEDLA